MTNVWRIFAPGSKTGSQRGGSAGRSAGIAACALGVAALCGAALVPGARAGADAVSSLQAQAAQLSREMLYEQLQVTGFQQQHSADLATEAADEAQIATAQSNISQVRATIQKDVTTLQRAAVKAYVEGGTGVAGGSALFTAGSSQGASSVYAQVMTGNISVALDHLQSDRRTLQADLSAEQNMLAQAQKSAAAAATALADAQATAQTLANQHAAVTGKLAVAVAQQQAAQAAAARAAALAAMQAAARPAPPAATPSASPGTGLPMLPPFLRCVIQAESSGDYQAVSPTGGFMGAFQFSQSTWNVAAQLAGMPALIGVAPYDASVYDQDLLAIALYHADGEQPWYDPCRN